jgi:hypothetical protein
MTFLEERVDLAIERKADRLETYKTISNVLLSQKQLTDVEKILLVKCYIGLGFLKEGDDKGLSFFDRALTILKELKNSPINLHFWVLVGIGNVFMGKDMPQCKIYYQKALDLAESVQLPRRFKNFARWRLKQSHQFFRGK